MNEQSNQQGDNRREPYFEYRTVCCTKCKRACEAVIEVFDVLGVAVCPRCDNEFNFELE